MFSQVRPALASTLLLTLLLGLGYPLVVIVVAHLAFPAQAEGSLLRDQAGRVIGSSLIAQEFKRPGYLQPRPSAAGYDASASSGSNLGPLNPDLAKQVADRARILGPQAAGAIPADALTTSASGLDPDISPGNAHRQAVRVAAARGAPLAAVERVIADHTELPWLGVFGQARVNVLETNLALDAALPKAHPLAQ